MRTMHWQHIGMAVLVGLAVLFTIHTYSTADKRKLMERKQEYYLHQGYQDNRIHTIIDNAIYDSWTQEEKAALARRIIEREAQLREAYRKRYNEDPDAAGVLTINGRPLPGDR